MGSITDVPGFRVGQVQRIGDGWLTGVSVILPPPGTVAMADVGGGAPATREVTSLTAGGAIREPHAIVLTGGSSYGLIAAHGVMRYLAAQGRGHRVGPGPNDVVPIVPGAAIYDLGRGGDFDARPTEQMGFDAAAAADAAPEIGPVARGNVGAGTGATVDNETYKGGVGTASVQVETPDGRPVRVGAFAVANPYGVPTWGPRPLTAHCAGAPPLNTVLAVIATDADLDPGDLARTARVGQDGIARAIDPAHTLADGDTVFALSTGAVSPAGGARWQRDSLIAIQSAGAHMVAAAIRDAIDQAVAITTPAFTFAHFPGGRLD
jgi:L-aminopeptidase/D-esterase-like protein